MTDPGSDPVDVLLRDAFAADLASVDVPAVTARVMARIRSHDRWRRLLLGTGMVIGLGVAAVASTPTLETLIAALQAPLRNGLQDSALTLGALAILAGVWMLILEEEAG